MSEYQRHAARVARAVKGNDPDEARSARQDYYTEKLADYIRAVVDKAPPLRPDQLTRLRSLLAPSSDPA